MGYITLINPMGYITQRQGKIPSFLKYFLLNLFYLDVTPLYSICLVGYIPMFLAERNSLTDDLTSPIIPIQFIIIIPMKTN